MKKVKGNIMIENKKKGSKEPEFKEKELIFYDEKEWRFVPNSKDCIEILERKESYEFDVNKKSKSLNLRLPLTIKDISYIIVAKEDSRTNMIHFIKDGGVNGSDDDKNLLISRIITKKQIREDF